MRTSQFVFRTLRETPSDASTVSHQFLLRAGFIRQVSPGVYVFTHLGHRVLRKAEQIVREEMDKAGAIELLLSITQPRELWDETARWDRYRNAGILFHGRDRKGADYCLAPTAEEVVTWLAREAHPSHKDVPFNWYQIGWKFRDEIRPRFGIVRGREFLMKDAYSFDRDVEGMRRSYEAMRAAYCRVFERCGFRFRMVEADSGAIGGTGSAEFMALADSGEDVVLSCTACTYGANREKAICRLRRPVQDMELRPLRKEPTPGVRTVDELTAFFEGLPASQMVKTIVYLADGKPVVVCMRGDLEINEVKLANLIGATELGTADADTVVAVTHAPVGFAGPIDLSGVPIYFDVSTQGMTNLLCGGNEQDVHFLDVNFGRDFTPPDRFYDLHNAREGELCPRCEEGVLQETRGIELGHIFQLGTVYSKKMDATFTDADGTERPFVMGCYGIGVSRIVAAIIEQSHDDAGMIWPSALAPYQVIVIPAGQDGQMRIAGELCRDLAGSGFEVVLDDRTDLRAGPKFVDADLLGYPLQVIVGRKASEGMFEVKVRRTGERLEVGNADLISTLKTYL